LVAHHSLAGLRLLAVAAVVVAGRLPTAVLAAGLVAMVNWVPKIEPVALVELSPLVALVPIRALLVWVGVALEAHMAAVAAVVATTAAAAEA
jgi:hypothetical protein